MSRAEDLLDTIHFASLSLECLRDHWHAAPHRTIHPLNLAAALETIRKARDELLQIEPNASTNEYPMGQIGAGNHE